MFLDNLNSTVLYEGISTDRKWSRYPLVRCMLNMRPHTLSIRFLRAMFQLGNSHMLSHHYMSYTEPYTSSIHHLQTRNQQHKIHISILRNHRLHMEKHKQYT